MIVFPNAKINLGLHITGKREDGYHNIETCFYPVQWCDILEIVEADHTKITVTGVNIPGNGDSENIVIKAYKLLKLDFNLPQVNVHLHKTIPVGAGLGGGSSDASFALKAFNDLFGLKLEDKSLINYAEKLGADCPFFIKNKPVMATGIGNVFNEIKLDLSGLHILLIYPNIHISTKEAYDGVYPKVPMSGIEDILMDNTITEWHSLLKNDFEEHLFVRNPLLKEIKSNLYEKGALYASMTGSGSCIYGIFDQEPKFELSGNFVRYTCVL